MSRILLFAIGVAACLSWPGSVVRAGFNLPSTGSLAGFRNRIVNGGDVFDQLHEGASTTLSTTAVYTSDHFLASATGASATGQRIASGAFFQYQITGAASVTGIKRCQNIEAAASADLAGSQATLSLMASDSLLTSMSYSIGYPATTNAFGTLASPATLTSIASGSFTISSTLGRQSVTVSVPSGATTGLQICVAVGAQTSGTWTQSNWQLELGNQATTFEARPLVIELELCQRYLYKSYPIGVLPGAASQTATALSAYTGPSTDATSFLATSVAFPTQMFKTPTITLYSPNTASTTVKAYMQNAAADVAASSPKVSASAVTVALNSASTAARDFALFHFVASAELQ